MRLWTLWFDSGFNSSTVLLGAFPLHRSLLCSEPHLFLPMCIFRPISLRHSFPQMHVRWSPELVSLWDVPCCDCVSRSMRLSCALPLGSLEGYFSLCVLVAAVGFTSYEDMCWQAAPTHPGPVFPGVSCLSKLSPLFHGCLMVFPTCHWMNHQMWIYLNTERDLLC